MIETSAAGDPSRNGRPGRRAARHPQLRPLNHAHPHRPAAHEHSLPPTRTHARRVLRVPPPPSRRGRARHTGAPALPHASSCQHAGAQRAPLAAPYPPRPSPLHPRAKKASGATALRLSSRRALTSATCMAAVEPAPPADTRLLRGWRSWGREGQGRHKRAARQTPQLHRTRPSAPPCRTASHAHNSCRTARGLILGHACPAARCVGPLARRSPWRRPRPRQSHTSPAHPTARPQHTHSKQHAWRQADARQAQRTPSHKREGERCERPAATSPAGCPLRGGVCQVGTLAVERAACCTRACGVGGAWLRGECGGRGRGTRPLSTARWVTPRQRGGAGREAEAAGIGSEARPLWAATPRRVKYAPAWLSQAPPKRPKQAQNPAHSSASP